MLRGCLVGLWEGGSLYRDHIYRTRVAARSFCCCTCVGSVTCKKREVQLTIHEPVNVVKR